MLNKQLILAALACALSLAFGTHTADAQSVGAATRFDIGVGLGYGGGGGSNTRDQRTGVSVSALLTQKARTWSVRPIHYGLSLRQFEVRDNRDDCQGPIDACFARYPQLRSVGVVAGIQLGARPGQSSSVRLLGGPAFVWTGDRRSVGLEGRIDFVLTPRQPVALVMSLESGVASNLGNNSYWTGALGLGVRLQR